LNGGIILEGSEVKSLRKRRCQHRRKANAAVEDGELWFGGLLNVAPYKQAKTFTHEERRRRKLLVSKKQLSHL